MEQEASVNEDHSTGKKKKKTEDQTGIYGTKSEPRKSLGVYFKNQGRLIMSSIAIADKKAAILIRVNTTIISALIVFESYFKANTNFNGQIVSVLVIGLSLSLLCALAAAKPFSYTMYSVFNKVIKKKYTKLEENNFMLFENVDFDKYEESMKKVVKSQDLQIGNMIRFNFFMGKSIARNFFLLEIAYTTFLITLFVVVILYLVAKFI